MIRKKEGFEGQRAIVLPRKVIAGPCAADPLVNGLYITDIGFYPKARYHFRQRHHGIDQHILIYCREGRGTATVGNRQYTLAPDDFIFIPAGSGHHYASDDTDAWTIYWVHFKGPRAADAAAAIERRFGGHHGRVTFQQKRLDLFEDMYASLERGYGNDNLGYANMCLWHYLAGFLYEEPFSLSEKHTSRDAVEQSISHMREQLGASLTLADLAGAANLSASHYSAIFRKRTGYSPLEYFHHLKIQKACQYLLFTDMRIKEIAYAVGIEDPYYFSRMFSKLMGVSPQQYRLKRGV